jgi:hypothetical protein
VKEAATARRSAARVKVTKVKKAMPLHEGMNEQIDIVIGEIFVRKEGNGGQVEKGKYGYECLGAA